MLMSAVMSDHFEGFTRSSAATKSLLHHKKDSFLEDLECRQLLHLTGIIYPQRNLIKQVWYIFLHICNMVGILGCIVVFFVNSSSNSSNEGNKVYTMITGVSQYLIINPGSYILLWKIRSNILYAEEPEDGNHKTLSVEALQSSIKMGFLFMLFFLSVPYAIYSYFYWVNANSTGLIIEALFAMMSYLSTTTILSGLLAIFVADQRTSYNIIKDIRERIDNKEMTKEVYLLFKKQLDSAYSVKVLNWLVLMALSNLALTIASIFVLEAAHTSLNIVLGLFFSLVAIFGREVFVLVTMLLEIGRVNEAGDQLARALATAEWDDRYAQVSLYMTIKEHEIGSRIFRLRPSRFQVLVQASSALFGILLSIVLRIASEYTNV
eukprot:gene30470-36828_t